jgi:hypothetical protein
MATHCDKRECIWLNVFDFLNSHDVGKCTLLSTLLQKSAKIHFRQVPMTVHVVQTVPWSKPEVVHLFDGNQGDGGLFISAEKTHSRISIE